ncbi:hypothetical protein Tco_0171408 [Tanacetum coccineum]
MDDGPSSLKKWKNKFFLIDRRVILDHLTWRYSYSCVSDDLPIDGYDRNDVERLRIHLIRLREMKELVLVRFGLSFVWSNKECDLVFRRNDDNSAAGDGVTSSTRRRHNPLRDGITAFHDGVSSHDLAQDLEYSLSRQCHD